MGLQVSRALWTSRAMRALGAVAVMGLLTTPASAVLGGGGGAQSTRSKIYRAPSGTELMLLIDEKNLGGSEVAVGEMTFPANLDSGEHTHGAIEIFYVISGELQHIVNGRTEVLKPGMAGFVRPPDKVRHKVGPEGPCKVVVIWSPGTEAAAVLARWQQQAEP